MDMLLGVVYFAIIVLLVLMAIETVMSIKNDRIKRKNAIAYRELINELRSSSEFSIKVTEYDFNGEGGE